MYIHRYKADDIKEIGLHFEIGTVSKMHKFKREKTF